MPTPSFLLPPLAPLTRCVATLCFSGATISDHAPIISISRKTRARIELMIPCNFSLRYVRTPF
jgi:hypothetical protein